MKTYYVGQRLFSLNETAGKTVSRTVHSAPDLLQFYTDGSFWCGYIDDGYIVERTDISCDLAVEVGIASEEAIKDHEQQKINRENYRTQVRREQYEELKKEFEGGTS